MTGDPVKGEKTIGHGHDGKAQPSPGLLLPCPCPVFCLSPLFTILFNETGVQKSSATASPPLRVWIAAQTDGDTPLPMLWTEPSPNRQFSPWLWRL